MAANTWPWRPPQALTATCSGLRFVLCEDITFSRISDSVFAELTALGAVSVPRLVEHISICHSAVDFLA